MNNNHVYDMLVVGGGPGGYTAALYAARAGLDTIVLEKLSAGGQMALTEQIDNYPGFEDGIDGFSLAEKMQKQAERFGVSSEYAEVLRMDLTAVPKLLETSEGIFRGKTVVLATGADPRTLGIAGETELVGRGVAYCAACDGMFYKDKTVVVVGGGNSAAADALLLSRVAKKVILVHRRDTLRAAKIYHEPLAQAENVEFRWNSTVSALLSGDRLTGVRLRDTVTGEESVVDCDGVFVSVGRQPATALAAGQLVLDGGGYIVAERPRKPAFPAFTPWAMCGRSPSGRWSPPWRTAQWQSTWRRNISREASDMKKELKKLLRPAVFTLGGALAGLGYYTLVGCSTGSCAITSSPVNTMLYMGLMGWLLSGIFGSQKA